MRAVANIEKLDEHLKEVVQALHGAVGWAMSHQKEPELVDKAIQDCQEILEVIMLGKVKDWIN
jgi:hypothetical protein